MGISPLSIPRYFWELYSSLFTKRYKRSPGQKEDFINPNPVPWVPIPFLSVSSSNLVSTPTVSYWQIIPWRHSFLIPQFFSQIWLLSLLFLFELSIFFLQREAVHWDLTPWCSLRRFLNLITQNLEFYKNLQWKQTTLKRMRRSTETSQWWQMWDKDNIFTSDNELNGV